jgi:UDP-glucose:(heptosyl)LPS alpha-1,3-glucosyltransferase
MRSNLLKIALCYENVLPARGGCETYIAELSRRLAAEGHEVHLYACRWDASALPEGLHIHALPMMRGPRFLRPWRFAAACREALRAWPDQISIGFDKTWGLDILYPQGGLHVASAAHNLRKYQGAFARGLARAARWLDLAHWSFSALERRQYLTLPRPLIIANSDMVCRHFQVYYGIAAHELRVVRSAIDADRFTEHDRLKRRLACRQEWAIAPGKTIGLFVAMNYRLKGLEPLLHAVARLPADAPFRLVVAGNPRVRPWERLARRLGVANRVRFLGPRRDVENCYFAADFLVHPTFYDPCSLVVLEALACGLPVITTYLNGASELMHPPQEGFILADPHDHAQLAEGLVQLLDPKRRLACSQAARRAAAGWTFEQHYRQLLGVVAEAAARKQAA